MRFSHERLETFLSQFRRLIECESPSSDPRALAASAALVAGIGEELTGVRPRVRTVEGFPHVRFDLGTGPRRILLLGHHDTVWPRGTLASMPFSAENGMVRGPGADDMKGGILIALHAIALLRAFAGEDLLDGVSVLITADEELGSPTSRPLIESLSAGAEAVLVFESGGASGEVKIARKGVAIYEFEAVGRAAHAGVEPEKGVNATVELAHQVLRIAQLGAPELGTSVVPAVVHSGTTTNTVPARGTLAVDSRAESVAEQERVDASLRALTAVVPGARLVLHGGINRPPLEDLSSLPLLGRAQQIAEALDHPPVRPLRVGGGSDANFAAGVGALTLDGLGTVGGGSHADDEHALIEWIPRRVELVAGLLGSLLEDPLPHH
ncbi:M20/M25/M40 family metallo-hydrolase [Brevibacterium album]|uniref:M20/M25/M40 family metallo-hydrolase n=1 Tax=Brevibacterium album TaxID=417948 RepID=UPI00048E89D3|nr:M20/M25/M40 family metallo-hydrolase [Brevibacterium album]